MVVVKTYKLPSTDLIPNSPHPVIHYPGLLNTEGGCNPGEIYDTVTRNGWPVQWLIRYGQTQSSHYHSETHECMAVLSGSATIRFGVADKTSDMHENTWGTAREAGGLEVQADVGDVFIVPAGVAHKTFDAKPLSPFAVLSPGDSHSPVPRDWKGALNGLELSGFTMIGAYPEHANWDFAQGGENAGNYDKVWSVPLPEYDPILGRSHEGLCSLWGLP